MVGALVPDLDSSCGLALAVASNVVEVTLDDLVAAACMRSEPIERAIPCSFSQHLDASTRNMVEVSALLAKPDQHRELCCAQRLVEIC